MRPRQVFDYLALAGLWGGSFLLILKVVAAFGPVGAVTMRALVACGLLLALAAGSRRRLVFGSWRPLAVVGATTVAGQLLGLSYATPRIGTAMSAIFVATIPLWSMVIGQLWGIEHLTAQGRVGLVLGLLGMALLVGFPAVRVDGTFWAGCAAMLGSTLSAAYGSNYARKHLQAIGSWEQSIGAFLTGGLLTLPFLAVAPPPRLPSLADLGYLVMLAGLCSSLTYVLYFRLVAEAGATIAVSVEFLVTVVAVAIGALVLHEPLTAVQLAGAAVIIAGCTLVLGLVRPRARAHRAAAPN